MNVGLEDLVSSKACITAIVKLGRGDVSENLLCREADFVLGPEELLAAFPSAKFILTRRPAERWHHSINSTFCQMHDSWFMGIVNKLPFFPFTRFNVQVPALNAIIRTKFAPNMAGVESWKDLCESKELGTIKPPLNIC